MPELAGRLTRLRPWRPGDAAALAAAWRDPLICRHLPVPSSVDEPAALRWIEQRDKAWAERVSLDLAVTDSVSGEVTGEVGFSQFDDARCAALVGWWTAKSWRGQGRASEAVRQAVDWALSSGLLKAVVAEIDASNVASMAVARHAGLTQIRALHPDPSKAEVRVFARAKS